MTWKTISEVKRLPFWDGTTGPGEQCIVDCFPIADDETDTDCPSYHVIVGVMGEDGLFRSEEAEPFNPGVCIWRCGLHFADGRSHVEHTYSGRSWPGRNHCTPGQSWKPDWARNAA